MPPCSARYSGSPSETFFTGGGAHVFHNFERSEDYQNPTVEDAFAHSVNLSFVRLMRDWCGTTRTRAATAIGVLGDPDNPARADYLRRFADKRRPALISGASTRNFDGLTPDEAAGAARQAYPAHPAPLGRRLPSVRPDASALEHRQFLARASAAAPTSTRTMSPELYEKYAPKLFSLNDRGYLAGIHPLELWLVAYLQANPGASRGQLMDASAQARQSAYAWLFKTRNAHKQDVRIRILLEEDAFDRILAGLAAPGLSVRSAGALAGTAIGSSGDRPDALAELMGIIINGGVKLPTSDLERAAFRRRHALRDKDGLSAGSTASA